jgi:MFS family permease
MGAMHLARPLFAASFGVPVFLVVFVYSTNALARLISGPITGFLVDRWGRKPLLIAGVAIRTTTALGEYFATSYVEFLLWEFIGGFGVSIWNTGSQVLIADVTEMENRGRAVAVRSMSVRLGNIAGPFIGALLTTAFDIRSIFLFNVVTKLAVIVITLFLIKETRPEPAKPETGQTRPTVEKLRVSIFMTRGFLVISFATFALGMMTQGVFSALFPLYVQDVVDFGPADIGYMITLASVVIFLVSYPNGILVDRYGRRKTLIPGLLVLGLSGYLLAQSIEPRAVYFMVVVYGIGSGMTTGTSQVYAMDLAPERRRGAFLGIWSAVNHLSAVLAPLLLGLLAETVGLSTTFVVVSVILAISALSTWMFGPETLTKSGKKVVNSSG